MRRAVKRAKKHLVQKSQWTCSKDVKILMVSRSNEGR